MQKAIVCSSKKENKTIFVHIFRYFTLEIKCPLFEITASHSDKIDIIDTWKAMEMLVTIGLARTIGVCNFNSKQLEYVLSKAWIPPVVNQVECSPRFRQPELLKFCNHRGVKVIAYEPLGRIDAPDFLKDPKIKEIAEKYFKTPAQVILRYMVGDTFDHLCILNLP